jgi:serine/threonine-protein kinase HipA
MFTDLPGETYKRLPAMLADALPDDFGNALIDSYMAQKGVDKSRITPLDRLAYMGNRAMGALEFRPNKGPKTTVATAIEMGELVLAARKAIQGSINDDTESETALKRIIEVGTSAGGARAKAVIAWNRESQEIRSGQVDAPAGFEQWILKFDGMGKDSELGESQEYGRIEYAYHLMAKKAGIKMSECQLLEENNRAHFMTKRFDRREDNEKIHMQTLCAMGHLDYKKRSVNSYEQLFLIIQKLELGHQAIVQSFRRMVFNIVGKNCDDHTKNFSFLLKEGGAWELSPAYDVTFAFNPDGQWTYQHLMSVNGKFQDITIDDVLDVANRVGVGEVKDIIADANHAIDTWSDCAGEAGVSQEDTKRIQKHHVKLK